MLACQDFICFLWLLLCNCISNLQVVIILDIILIIFVPRILGAEALRNLTVDKYDMELVAERDLAEEMNGNALPKPVKGQNKLKHENGIVEQTMQQVVIKWNNVELHNFSRLEHNTVYKQFFRIRYTVVVTYNTTEYKLQVRVRYR